MERAPEHAVVADLSVFRRDRETLEVSSGRTRGRCATVFQFGHGGQLHVVPFLIPWYMQGITTGEILAATKAFLAGEGQAGVAPID